MQIEVRPTLIVNTKVDGRASVDLIWLSQLLKDIGQGSSLVVASKKSGTSYRGAWGKLNQVEAELGMPLIIRTKGHGSEADFRDLEVTLAEYYFVHACLRYCFQD